MHSRNISHEVSKAPGYVSLAPFGTWELDLITIKTANSFIGLFYEVPGSIISML